MPFRVSLDGQVIYSGVAETRSHLHEFATARLEPGTHKIELISDSAGMPPGDERLLGIALKNFDMQAAVPIALGEWINARDARLRWQNFSPVEFDWRWTLGERSFIEFECGSDAEAATITLFGHAAKRLEIRFLFNGELIHCIDGERETAAIELPPTAVRKGVNRLEVHIPGVQAFSAKDKRRLGLAILDLRVGEGPAQGRSASAGRKIDEPVREDAPRARRTARA
jgi:hypothetical protein